METRTACPNCGHQSYIALRCTFDGGVLKMEPLNQSKAVLGAPDPDRLIRERLDKIFLPGVVRFTVEFIRNVTLLTPVVKKSKLLTGTAPANCPDCGRTMPLRGGELRSVAPMGYMQFAIHNQTGAEADARSKMFPDGVEWALDFRRTGNTLVLRSILPTQAEAPELVPGRGDALAQVREQAIMDGIEGAETMTLDELYQAQKGRKKLAAVPA